MIWAIARHEWRRQRAGLSFWLLLAFGQMAIAWLAFTQLEAFAEIAAPLAAARLPLSAMDLVVAPTLNSLVLLMLLGVPLLAMGSIAGEVHSGRIMLWLAAPVGSLQIAAGKTLGLWFGGLPLLLSALTTLAALGLGIALDTPRFALSVVGLLLFSLWLSCVAVWLSSLFEHPAAALATSYALLLSLWLLDGLGDAESAWHWLALMPHLKPFLLGLWRSQDTAFFVVTGLAAVLLAGYRTARRRGEL